MAKLLLLNPVCFQKCFMYSLFCPLQRFLFNNLIQSFAKSLRLAWLGRRFVEGLSPWEAFVTELIIYSENSVELINYNVKEYNINSTLYKELLRWWVDFRTEFSTKSAISECFIWNNKNIR